MVIIGSKTHEPLKNDNPGSGASRGDLDLGGRVGMSRSVVRHWVEQAEKIPENDDTPE